MSLRSTGKSGRYGMRQPWLLLYNCQVMGLANSLNLLCDDIQVEYYDPPNFRKQAKFILGRMRDFERVLVAPQLESELGEQWSGNEKVWRIPTISFNAYHPDICYLLHSGSPLKGPLGDYHSLIAYAAYTCGMSETRALALYCESVYDSLGYFNRWDHSRKALLDSFSSHGFDIGAKFVEWSRNGPFMYSLNHPRVHCVRDVASAILGRAGLDARYLDALPHDNLANGPIFPVYTEIASHLGVDGSYLFKLGGRYQFIQLEEFVSECFRLYRDTPRVGIRPEFERMLGNAMAVIKALQ
ncbi:WcbI family polysaccharide biosynthesis putative acetyltransferase [Luteimonas sp. 50]|uniref:WcbI family polysaccharide biosynthesis putative acetyltransferase n=1 Tax=Cognatiluteimonas sedimenti TaxID=2927791 RepID=A0ABT0A6R6_9GAMM|nr:WcbI family polysaccharide biosynthesis putative acetyltransferase [Lysobacter sedimenti]MCJ0826676.1 WcbI family polysaccharide biosynthesis putative acetyltransferase [Lysobacter sedimenti]